MLKVKQLLQSQMWEEFLLDQLLQTNHRLSMKISQSETTEVDFPNCIFFFLLIIQLLILCKQCCQTVDRSFAPPLNSMSSGEHLHMLSLVCLFRRITNYAIIIGCCIYVDVKTHWCALERGEPLMSSLQGNLIKLPIWLLVFVRKNNNKDPFFFCRWDLL